MVTRTLAHKRLQRLDLKAPDPVGAYVAFKKIGNLLYISGQLPIESNGNIRKGKIGKNLTLKDGQEASKSCHNIATMAGNEQAN